MEEMYLPKTSKKSFSTIPINPVGLASHLTTNETNQVEKNAKIKGKSKTNPFTKSHSQTTYVLVSSALPTTRRDMTYTVLKAT